MPISGARSFDGDGGGGSSKDARNLDKALDKLALENPKFLRSRKAVGINPRRSDQAEEALQKMSKRDIEMLQLWFSSPITIPCTGIPSVVEELRPGDLLAALIWSHQRKDDRGVGFSVLLEDLTKRYGDQMYDATHGTLLETKYYLSMGEDILQDSGMIEDVWVKTEKGTESGFKLDVTREMMNPVCDYVLALPKAEHRNAGTSQS